jgi:hypothetical protein
MTGADRLLHCAKNVASVTPAQAYRRPSVPGFDEKIVSMYARGMTVREIQGHLLDLYDLEVSPDLVDDHRRGSGDGRRMAKSASARPLPPR